MDNSVDHYAVVILDFKEDTVRSHSKTILRGEVGQLLHVARQVLLERRDGVRHTRGVLFGQSTQILDGSWLELDQVLHVLNLLAPADNGQPSGRRREGSW